MKVRRSPDGYRCSLRSNLRRCAIRGSRLLAVALLIAPALAVAAPGTATPATSWSVRLNDGWRGHGPTARHGLEAWNYNCDNGVVTDFYLQVGGTGGLGAYNQVTMTFSGGAMRVTWYRPADGGSFSVSNAGFVQSGNSFAVSTGIPATPFLVSHHHCAGRAQCGTFEGSASFVCPAPTPTPTPNPTPTPTPTPTPAPILPSLRR